MSKVSDFIDDESRHERALAKAMHWDYIEDQQKGSCYDFIAPDGAKIEAKFDWDSIKTGNHYLEFGQTSDLSKVMTHNWVPSGFSLSAEEADYWVVINNDWLRMFEIAKLRAFIEANRRELKVTRTRAGVNHNRPGQFSRAYLIPFEQLDQHCMLKIASPVTRGSN